VSDLTPQPSQGVYGIGIAAELVGMGGQTLRLYVNWTDQATRDPETKARFDHQ
jgi:hypothetical protein